MSEHRFPVRIYWEDTDAGGVVYYANYLKFAERARTELVRERGLDQRALAERDGVWIVVRRASLDYRAPARLGDELTVATQIKETSGARVRLAQHVRRGEELLVEIGCELAAIDRSGRPVRFPPALVAAFAA
ncbi:MAG: ybgC [Rhodospirillales bacterium]|jgi:acyl-CoA thioester hydrolase|nr:ybgC [Rhodospirillales bacterium]